MDIRLCRAKYKALAPTLTERARRIWAATEARAAGRGGISGVARATGIAYSTIVRGLKELEAGASAEPGRVRRPGAGRKRTLDKDPSLLADFDGLVEPTASGDPQSPLRWMSKSVRQLAGALQAMGHAVSRQLVAELLAAAGYSLQANRKTREGAKHPDRDAQFRYINQHVRRFQAAAQPVISVDTKKKELVGDFKNAGQQWRPKGRPEPVRVHDFIIPEHGKAIPYGVYDLTRNAGWVSVGIDHDTASFAARTIRRWWQKMGRPRYRRARSLLVTADAGGSNGARVRLWKWELQQLANRTRLAITVCHFPPGTSKWNKIEHRLFSYISTNWRGQPLVSLAVIVNLIAATRTAAGLRVRCELDHGAYPKGQEVSDAQMATLNLAPHRFHGDWNYTLQPSRKRR
ncbi:MAG: ISAzo13 family transposase [Candidatus Methylomirabilia bacterium]